MRRGCKSPRRSSLTHPPPVVAGSVFTGIQGFIDHPDTIPDTLGTAVPSVSVLFITFVTLKCLAGAASGVGNVVPAVIYLLKTRLLGARHYPRRDAATWAPRATALGSETSNDLLVLLLVLVYSTIAPIIQIAGLVFFFTHLLAYRANMIYRDEPAYDGHAALWMPLRNRVLVSLAIYLVLLVFILGLKRAPVQAALLIPVALIFALLCWLEMRSSSSLSRRLLIEQPMTEELGGSGGGGGKSGGAEESGAEEGAPGEVSVSYRLPALRPSTSAPRYGEPVEGKEGSTEEVAKDA